MSVEIGGWNQVDLGGGAQVFYRNQRGGEADGLPRVHIRLERETPDAALPHFLPTLSLVEFNCAAKTRRVMLSTLYMGKGQTGRAYIGARGGWAPVVSGTAEAVVMQRVCGRG